MRKIVQIVYRHYYFDTKLGQPSLANFMHSLAYGMIH